MRTSTLALVILVIGEALLLFYTIRKSNQRDQALKEIQANRTLNAEIIDTFVASDSTRHQVIRERVLSNTETVLVIDSAKMDSIARVLRIKERQINQLLIANAELRGKVKASAVEVDSLRNKTYSFITPYLKAKFAEKDSSLAYQYNADIGVVRYSEREGFLGPRYNYIDLSSSDPNMTINGLQQFTIRERDKATPWGIGAQAGYYFDLKTGAFHPAIGVGISFNVLRF